MGSLVFFSRNYPLPGETPTLLLFVTNGTKIGMLAHFGRNLCSRLPRSLRTCFDALSASEPPTRLWSKKTIGPQYYVTWTGGCLPRNSPIRFRCPGGWSRAPHTGLSAGHCRKFRDWGRRSGAFRCFRNKVGCWAGFRMVLIAGRAQGSTRASLDSGCTPAPHPQTPSTEPPHVQIESNPEPLSTGPPIRRRYLRKTISTRSIEIEVHRPCNTKGGKVK